VNAPGETVAIDEHTGAVLWTIGSNGGDGVSVAVDDTTVYEAEGCARLHAYDEAAGYLRWSNNTNFCANGIEGAPALHDGWIWVRDRPTGNMIFDSKGTELGTFAGKVGPAFHGDTAFYLASSTVSAVEISSDTLRWSFTGDGMLCMSPVVAGGGGQVFVGSQSGNIYELDEATGKQIAVDNVGSPVVCPYERISMAIAENHLLVPASNELVVY
jgi:outer membrane protein assembly factor BamB